MEGAMTIVLLILTCLGLLVVRVIAKSSSNRHATMPLILRAFFAASAAAWFLAIGSHHGGGIALLPSVLILVMALSEWEKIAREGALFALIIGQLAVLAAAFCFWSGPVYNANARKQQLKEAGAALVLLVLFALVPVIGELTKPCRYEFNNVCFDKPNADRKPLELNLQLFDPEKNVPIVGALVSLSWVEPTSGYEGICQTSFNLRTDENGKVHTTAPSPNWVPGDASVIAPGLEPVRFTEVFEGSMRIPERVKHVVNIDRTIRSKYPAWGQALLTSGYSDQVEHHHHDYVKYFPAPSAEDQKRGKQKPTDAGGALMYLMSQRSAPNDFGSTPIHHGARCGTQGMQSALPIARAVLSHNQLEESKWNGLAAKIALCDPKWDSTPETEKVNLGGMILTALRPLDVSANSQVEGSRVLEATTALKQADLHADLYSNQGMRALTKPEREALCAALDPFYADLNR